MSGEPVPYAALLALQELDMLIDQANHRRSSLEALAELAVLDRRLAELSAADAEAALAADGLAQRRDELDAAVAVSSARIAQIAARTEAMVASSYRDQEAMAEEIASLRRRRSELEDAELEVMEELEPLEARLAASAQERAEIDRDRVACLGRLAEGERAIDAELAALALRRSEAATAIPAALLATYEALRAKLGGVGAAAVLHGSCGGCHLRLPATELERVRHADATTLVFCEQCGRLLCPQ